MIDNSLGDPPKPGPTALISFDSHEFPWWLVGMVAIIASMGAAIVLDDGYNEAFGDVIRGDRRHLRTDRRIVRGFDGSGPLPWLGAHFGLVS